MRQTSSLSYELSLKVHTSPHISRHLRPNHPPFWIERRAISRVITPPYTFYEDPVRGTLVHARTGRNQVVPQNRGESRSLCPEKCTGIWFLPSPDLARQLQAVEADMLAAFTRIQIVDHRQTPSIEDMTLAGYLRQLFDHFLNHLFKQFNRSYSPVSGGPGAFETPIPLEAVEEPHMKNALKNKATGQSYRVGAWSVGDSESHVGQVDETSLAPLNRKRSREPERQPAAEPSAASAQVVAMLSVHLPMRGPPNIDQVESDPKRRRIMRVENLPNPEPRATQDQNRPNQENHSRTNNQQMTEGSIHARGGTDAASVIVIDSDSDLESDVGEWETFVYIGGRPVPLTSSRDDWNSQRDNASIKDAFLAGILSERVEADIR